MTKFIVALVVLALGFLLLRRMGIRFLPKARRSQAKSDFQKQLNIVLWIPPVLVALGVLYVAAKLIFSARS